MRSLSALVAAATFAAALTGCSATTAIVGAEKQEVYRFDNSFPVESASFRRSAEALGNPMVDGNRASLLMNGDEIFPAMTSEIRRAKTSVNLETYIFQPDEAGRKFADAMIEAAQRGVQVRLLVDAVGSKLGDLEKPLKDAGVHVRIYRPLRLFSIYKAGKRTHRKILVVDGRVAFTGGLGIAKQWLGDARNTKEWRDTQVRVEGPVVAQMQAVFAEDWTFTTGEILVGEKHYPALAAVGTVPAQTIKVSRGDATSLAKMLYFVAIKSARKSIHIANAYFLPDKQVREALVAAVKRGVDVQVMVPGRNIDLPMVRLASWSHYGDMLKGGVRIFEYTPTMLHNKAMVVDGVYATIGSINFDSRSMSKNAEESLAFHDRGFARSVEAMFEKDRTRCTEITYAIWKDRGFGKRLAETVSWVWEPYY